MFEIRRENIGSLDDTREAYNEIYRKYEFVHRDFSICGLSVL